jgi:hypothetical protein
MTVVYYFAQEDLENALGKATVTTTYDDDNDGVVEDAAINACRAFGTAECNSFLRGIHPTSMPLTTNDVPDEVKFAALDFGIAYTVRRRIDLGRSGEGASWTTYRDSAIEKMKRYVASLQRLPPTLGVPSNVGGEVVTSANPSKERCPVRGSFWEDMGDFSR